ncbi:uncharacterized protein B0H64DRAFT_63622 [Chaetomium fimeti]|uniref:Kelch repeat protein n=1 Tax=Chaetomium fimeti TaxID=1854472 RepID=A0AAE0H612_9PEZI|nr:hypothetical protein B0H64DRAFT_63622 [Chaetomium fimeti]
MYRLKTAAVLPIAMRSHRAASGLLALLGALRCALGAEVSDTPTVEDFLRRNSVSATVIGDYVYMDGGEMSQLLDGKKLETGRGSDPVNSTISINIGKSWTSSAITMRRINRPWGSKANQMIWTDKEAGAFYVWGGKWIGGRNMTENALWKFTADGNGGGTWALETPENPNLFNNLEQYEFGAFANTGTTGYSVGGLASGWTKKGRSHNQVVPGMVTFNMDTKIWQNGTTAFSPTDTIVTASAEYIPNFGPNGLIMLFGGLSFPHDTRSTAEQWQNAASYDLQNLTFFDPETKDTYWQIATGSVPPRPRSKFCVTGFETSDGGYDIFLSGGYNYRDKFPYDDAYVLSLPGFVWTKLPDPETGARQSHTCVSVGKRQVLSIGGTDTGWAQPDPAPQGLLLFDMTEMKWKTSYDANAAAYERATVIDTWYNNGSLDVVEWSSNAVRDMFASKSTTDPGSTSSPSPSPSGTGSESESTPVGAIAGGVVGGVAGIALIAGIVWLLMRRRRKNNGPGPGTESTYYDDGRDAPEAAKYGSPMESTYKMEPQELNSQRPYAELHAQRPYAELPVQHHHADATTDSSATFTNPLLGHTAAVEMDATPSR